MLNRLTLPTSSFPNDRPNFKTSQNPRKIQLSTDSLEPIFTRNHHTHPHQAYTPCTAFSPKECPKRSSQPRALPTGESRDPASNMETWKYLCRQGPVSWLRPLSPEEPLGTRAEAFSSRRASRILGRTRAPERKSRRSVQRARKRKSRSAAGVAATDCPRSGNVSVYTLC